MTNFVFLSSSIKAESYAVATRHHLATDIGMKVLEEGGNAIDAAVAVAFAVILGKEAFGGTGMNIWNIALLARVFVFFAYPTTIAGDEVWVSGFDGLAEGTAATYGWAHNLSNTLFGWLGLDGYNAASTAVVDGYTGATPLALAYQG